MLTTVKGVVAAGHPETAKAAEAVLREGGNAFDACLAAHLTACIAEPVLTSLGGGGFLLARTAAGREVVYDFFPQTPRRRRDPGTVDFYPIQADFGTVTQEFHIGFGSIATPGTVKGIFAVHRDLGSLPMARIVEPAARCAREGIAINALQAYTLSVVGPIYSANAACRALYGSRTDPARLLGEGEVLRIPEFADALEALAAEGEDLFYRGAMAQRIVRDSRQQGGHLTAADLACYQVAVRRPLVADYRGARLLTNPPPSSGGLLIAFALSLLEAVELSRLAFGGPEHLTLLARAMEITNRARRTHVGDAAPEPQTQHRLFAREFLQACRSELRDTAVRLGATTHVSVIDRWGNVASMTVSNGEGSAYVVPETGIMLNNMLGEEDINPQGFHRWRPNRRLSSMMAPTLVLDGGREIAMGSGGSNRLRTAILQVLANLLDFRMPPPDAVEAPRIHVEDGLLHLEGGISDSIAGSLQTHFPRLQRWEDKNLFFGGVHTALADPARAEFDGAGDSRRGGVCIIVQ
jgi:gamma-glutamyltranspeptidase / glutathione hydrolase